MEDLKKMNSFLRIAMARIKSDYPFAPQRAAVAAHMYRKWTEKKK
jgi:hypothetical protein